MPQMLLTRRAFLVTVTGAACVVPLAAALPDAPDADWQYYTITDVEPATDGWMVGHTGHGFRRLVLWVPSPDPRLPTPRVGATLLVSGRGFGYPVQGILIDGYRYC